MLPVQKNHLADASQESIVPRTDVRPAMDGTQTIVWTSLRPAMDKAPSSYARVRVP